jgi:NADP-dependent 3-hydroxy acid dehydrogenase YdfG
MIADSPVHERMKNVLKPDDIAQVVEIILKLPIRAVISDIDIRPNNP